MSDKSRSRLVEWGKSLLIVILALSMLYLLSRTLLPEGILVRARNLLDSDSGTQTHSVSPQPMSNAVRPVRLAVYRDNLRYGVQYDQEKTDAAFASFGTLFSEALSSAGSPEKVSEQIWRSALSSTGIYLDFLYPVPMTTLSAWWGDGLINSVLTGTARRICLAADENDGVSLFYINEDDGSYYACATTLSLSFHLEAAVEEWDPNGAAFAFEEPDMDVLAPYTLVTATPQPKVYAAQNPLVMDNTRMTELLDALSFHAQGSVVDPAQGGQLAEGSDFLRLSSDGRVAFHSIGDSDYRFAIPENSIQGALDYVQKLAEKTVGAWCDQARICLAGVEQIGDQIEITFQYTLNGTLVALPEEQVAARFVVYNGAVIDFTLYLRAYTATETTTLVPPETQACAAMRALNARGKELVLRYQDSGGDQVSAGWIAK